MAINPSDVNLLLLYGMDESGTLSTRANSGNLGSTEDLSVSQSSGTDGIPTVVDGGGGKALDLFRTRTDWTTAFRRLRSSNSVVGASHSARPAIPNSDANNDFAFGCRFQYGALNTGGGAGEQEILFGLIRDNYTSNNKCWCISLRPDHGTTPTAADLVLHLGNWWDNVASDGTWTATGGPSTYYYIDPDVWYRVVVRFYYDGSTGLLAKVYLYNESTAVTYTWTLDVALSVAATAYTAFQNSNTYSVAVPSEAASNTFPLLGYLDEVWLYDAPLADSDALILVVGGISVPYTAPDYTINGHDTRVSWTNESTSYPPTRQLPVGGLRCRHPAGSYGTRMRLRYEGFRPSRPWALRRSAIRFDSTGPKQGQQNNEFIWDGLVKGIARLTGRLDPSVVVDSRNIEYTGGSPRRRKGFKVRRDVSSERTSATNAFSFWRAFDDGLHGLFKVGTKLHYDTGGAAAQLDTGWSPTQLPSFGILDNRCTVLTPDDQGSWRGGSTLDSFGHGAPTTGSVASTTGTLVGTYFYSYTWYDPTTGDETGPKEVGSVTLATDGALLSSMDTSPTDSRFSQQRIYRTVAGGASPNYLLIATQNSAATYTDASGADGTVSIGKVVNTFITSVPPDTFGACTVHLERMFYFIGQTDSSRIYWSEPNEPQRWYANSFVTLEGPVRAAIGSANRLIAWTDHTVELIESDFVRDENGAYQIRRTVLSRRVGCMGHGGPVDAAGEIYWLDRRGIYHLQGQRVVQISKEIENVFPNMNTGEGSRFNGSYNHMRQQVWWTISMSGSAWQIDSSRRQTQVVLNINSQENKWAFHNLEASYVHEFDDDLNGVRMGIIDHAGVFKEIESYEGDGIDDPDDTALCEAADGITDITGSVVTVSGSPAWTVDALRGVGVVLRDVSAGTFAPFTIQSNTAGTFTVDSTPDSALGSGDGYYLGGIAAYLETAEQDMGTTNLKTARMLHHEFDDLTTGYFA